MEKKATIPKIWLCFFPILVLILSAQPSQKEDFDLPSLYSEAKFPLIAEYLNNKDYETLTHSEKLLLVECMARTAQGDEAEEKLNKILADYPPSSETFFTAGIVYFSKGRLHEASKYLDEALRLDPDCHKASLAKVMLHLYFQQYSEAQAMYEELARKYPEFAKSYLFHLVGIEVYNASRNPMKISELHQKKADEYEEKDKKLGENYQKTARLFRKASRAQTYQLKTQRSMVAMPFAESLDQTPYVTVLLRIKDKNFKIILDTGNSAGWMVHSRELNKLLHSKGGGRLMAQIGTQAGLLYGHYIYCDQVDFGAVKIDHLVGGYVPKPNATFHDATLNPVFLRNRVMTLDFIEEKLIIRTKERFNKDLNSAAFDQSEHFTELPWYGYEHVFIPVSAEGEKPVIAMIETGAEDIALRLNFARKHRLPLEPKLKYLGTGEIVHYFKTPVKISAGDFHFNRNAADVWPLDRFYDRITGFAPDVIIGPSALKERFSLSFNPFEKKIVLADISY